MKKVSGRAVCTLVLAGMLMLGLTIFTGLYLFKADDWVVFPGSPHVYSGGNLNSGIITDREGEVLLDSTDGRKYADDVAVRKATLHLLGDREGYIAAPLLSEYADALVGFDILSGVYSLSDKVSTAQMTISADVQVTALDALGGRAGTVGVYNYKTGEILCAVSTPNYDPDNVPDIEGDTSGTYSGVYVNRFFNATFVPGSIFKLVTAAAALENIPDIEAQQFNCTGSFDVEGDTVNCNGVHGIINFETALAKSCNVAFGQIALELGPETLQAYADKLGINESFVVDGFHTLKGNFDMKDAAKVNVAWGGIGQYTNLINPCGFMRFMGAVAGGGKCAEPYLMAGVDSKKLTSDYRADKTMTEQLLKPETCRRLAEMMRNNVKTTYGQGNFGNLSVCAKSGTAEVGEDLIPHATFAGFVQDTQYPLAFIVVVENAGSGSAVCASIAGTVLQACAEVLNGQ